MPVFDMGFYSQSDMILCDNHLNSNFANSELPLWLDPIGRMELHVLFFSLPFALHSLHLIDSL
jgi:hypothetical protein